MNVAFVTFTVMTVRSSAAALVTSVGRFTIRTVGVATVHPSTRTSVPLAESGPLTPEEHADVKMTGSAASHGVPKSATTTNSMPTKKDLGFLPVPQVQAI